METTFEPSCFAVRISPGTYAEIEVSGELDLAGVPVLESAVRDLELPAVKDAVLDLRRLAFIDAAGLDAVLDLYAECLNVATVLTIIPGPRSVQRLFELTRLDRLLPFSRP
jgi:anti-sigma B factor antagonist